MTAPRKPDAKPFWPIVNEYALLVENLPRVLAAMNLQTYCGAINRGAIKWWRPDYLSVPTAAAVDSWFPPRAQDVRATCIEKFIASRRATVAPSNRMMRDAEVHLFAIEGKRRTNQGRILAVCSYEGEWRTADGANRGRDLIELGMWRWSCRFGQAAYRISKLLGWRSIPTVSAHA